MMGVPVLAPGAAAPCAPSSNTVQVLLHTETRWPPPRDEALGAIVQVRDALIARALAGNAAIAKYGDLVTNEHACERFLLSSKGHVRTAVEAFQLHLEWRVAFALEAVVDEDFADLKDVNEIYWGGRDKDGCDLNQHPYPCTPLPAH
jgi:hypothetical protein